jgi:hypothetical protein
MPDVPIADTCVCGSSHWHRPAQSVEGALRVGSGSGALEASRFLWCRQCGALRAIFDTHWQIPLSRAGDVARSVPLASDEVVTDPGTPSAKRASSPGTPSVK